MLFTFLLSLLFVGRSLAVQCNADNCLRAMQHTPTASAFCSTYTTAIHTATTSLPTYAASCSNLPSRISSACSCLITTTTSSSTTTTPTPTPTCTPSILQNTEFVLNQYGLPGPWVEMEHDAPGQNYFPYSLVEGNIYQSLFPSVMESPNYSWLTLQQPLSSVCNGDYVIEFQGHTFTQTAYPNSPSTPLINCTITFGLREFPGAIFSVGSQEPSTTVTSYQATFPLSGLPAGGAPATFFFDTLCTNVQYYPEIDISEPSFEIF